MCNPVPFQLRIGFRLSAQAWGQGLSPELQSSKTVLGIANTHLPMGPGHPGGAGVLERGYSTPDVPGGPHLRT